MNIVDEAVRLASAGLPVFPCREDKRPACPHGRNDATADPVDARRLWRRFPGPKIGVATGKASGLAVIDFDPPALPYHRTLVARRLLPQTLTHRTPRGGYHHVYLLPDPPVRCSASKLAPGVDVRGEGGSSMWPPSPGYTIVDEAPPAPFPRWVIVALRRLEEAVEMRRHRFANVERPASLEPLARFVARAGEGRRNEALFWAACRAVESGLPPEALEQAAIDCGLNKLEARQTIQSAIRRLGRCA